MHYVVYMTFNTAVMAGTHGKCDTFVVVVFAFIFDRLQQMQTDRQIDIYTRVLIRFHTAFFIQHIC